MNFLHSWQKRFILSFSFFLISSLRKWWRMELPRFIFMEPWVKCHPRRWENVPWNTTSAVLWDRRHGIVLWTQFFSIDHVSRNVETWLTLCLGWFDWKGRHSKTQKFAALSRILSTFQWEWLHRARMEPRQYFHGCKINTTASMNWNFGDALSVVCFSFKWIQKVILVTLVQKDQFSCGGMHLEHRFPFRGFVLIAISYTPDWCLRLGATSMMLFQNMVRVSGAGFVTQAKADEVSNFWKSKQAASCPKPLRFTVLCVLWHSSVISVWSGSCYFQVMCFFLCPLIWPSDAAPSFFAVTRCIRMSRKLWHKPWRTSAPMRNLWIDWRLQNRGPGAGNMTLGRSAWLLSHLKFARPSS